MDYESLKILHPDRKISTSTMEPIRVKEGHEIYGKYKIKINALFFLPSCSMQIYCTAVKLTKQLSTTSKCFKRNTQYFSLMQYYQVTKNPKQNQ